MENQRKLQIEYVQVDALVPYDKNPRNNDPAIDAVAASIKTFGFKVPMVIDEQNSIVCGHSRLRAVQKLIKQGELPDDLRDGIPCIRANDLTPEQIRAFRIADNKVAELAEWDEDLLKSEIEDLPEFDFESFGFDMDDFTSDMADSDTSEDEFDADAEPEEIRVRRGEIWQLGDHRLMCGDSTSEKDVADLMNGEKADLWLTDPPYNVDYEGGTGMRILNDSMGDSKFREFLRNAFDLAEKEMKPGAAFYIFHADSEGYNFRGACHDVGLTVRECLVWKKNALVLGRQDYQWIHEPCLYGWKDGAAHKWRSDRKQTTVLEFDRPKKSELHPTMKPIALFSYLMCNSTDRGDIVLETFGGSGTTLICAERTGRRCRIMELDERFATVILNRWEEDTGRVGVRIRNSGGDPCDSAGAVEDGGGEK